MNENDGLKIIQNIHLHLFKNEWKRKTIAKCTLKIMKNIARNSAKCSPKWMKTALQCKM